MRIQARVGHFGAGIFACGSLLYLSSTVGWSQVNSFSSTTEPDFAIEKSPGALLSEQQRQEQNQQLLQAIELVRVETEVHLRRNTEAVDRIRHDTELNLQRHAAAVGVKLDLLNQAFASERDRALQDMRHANRFALTSASIIAGVLLLEILFLAWISVRAVHRLAAGMSVWLAQHSPAPNPSATLEANLATWLTGGGLEETNLRLQNAIKRLELRLLDLENTASRFSTALNESPASNAPKASIARSPSNPKAAKTTAPRGVSLALGAGESLIFLPHDKGPTPFGTCRSVLQKLWKRLNLARLAKSD